MKKEYSFAKLPADLAEMKALPQFDRKDPYAIAALAVAAFVRFPEDKEACYAMIEDLNGPKALSVYDRQFIADRFSDKTYVPRSYFGGAVPANNYTPAEPWTIVLEELAHSRDQIGEGYLKLFLTSGGADNPRYLILRQKQSTGEWFLWEYAGILASIRIPVSEDPWA